MTMVHFVRHAKRDASARADEAGRAARALGEAGVERLYTSPLERAAATAAIVGVVRNLEPRHCELLRERADFGEKPGQSHAEFVAMWKRCSRERDRVPEVGDSSREAGRRLERFVADLERGVSVAAVTHGGVLADFLRNVFPIDVLEAASPEFARHPYSGDIVRECSITTVRVGERIELVRIAASEHLDS